MFFLALDLPLNTWLVQSLHNKLNDEVRNSFMCSEFMCVMCCADLL